MKIHHPASYFYKRTFDICVSLPVVLIVIPILALVIWVVQRFQSPGPLFYSQKRYGFNRKTFDILKFRTMHINDTPNQQALKGDARVYPFGRFLRKTSLDELPQFINVLLGSMSVNGPRPFLCEHVHQFERKFANYHKRHHVKPGITGLAQSMGYRGEIVTDNDLQKRLNYDLIYIRKWSFWMEIKLVFMTVKQVLLPPKTAY